MKRPFPGHDGSNVPTQAVSQIIVVENVDEKHLNKTIWLFHLYLLIINIFVILLAFASMMYFFESCQ